MKQLETYHVKNLEPIQKVKIEGGNPIRVVLGVVTTIISLGKAGDQAVEWFLEGWNNPN
jgi:hypothetical protein